MLEIIQVLLVYCDSARRGAHAHIVETSQRVRILGLGVFEVENLGQKTVEAI